MDRLEALEKALGEVVRTVQSIAEELKEIKKEVKQGSKTKPASIKIGKATVKLKESRYNGRKLLIIENGNKPAYLTLNRDEWLELRKFLDSHFGIADDGGSSSNSKPKSYNKKGYGKKSNNKPAVKVVKGYSKALDEEGAD